MSNSNLELNDLTKFRLDEINKIKDYFNAEIKERKDTVKKHSKYIVAFAYAGKLFIALSASFGIWHFKYCVICDGCWNTRRDRWSIFNCNIYCNNWCD